MLKKIKENLLPYSVAIAIPVLVGLFSALITKDNMSIYDTINKPPAAPPAWLFPIAWTLLYVLMGISSAIVFQKRDDLPEQTRVAFTYYAVSLILNFGWSIIFFNMGSYVIAFFWLLFLLYTVVKTAIAYYPISRTASLLQIPYILWLVFAGYLNFYIAFFS
jgi:tryptophan-rich sensory protein